MKKILVTIALYMACATAYAYDLPGMSSSGPFAKIENALQTYLSFMEGPWATAVVITSMLLAVAAWNFSPRENHIGTFVRVLVSGIVMMNVTSWLTLIK